MITDFQMGFVQQNIQPRLGRLVTDNTLAEVAVAGFVDNYIQNTNADMQISDFIAVVASDGNAWFYPTRNALGVWTLHTM
jgi:hypothetical protein